MKQDGALVRDQGAPIDRLRAKLETTMARVDALAGELFDARNEVDSLRAELASTQKSTGVFQEGNRILREDVARLHETLSRVANLDEQVDTIPLDKAFRILREMGMLARTSLAPRPPEGKE